MMAVTAERQDCVTPSRPMSAVRCWLAPPLTAFVFLVHEIVALCRPTAQFQDPGTGWHLATGRYILQTASIPRSDPFSFTAAGHSWVDYSWLFQTMAGLLEKFGGLPLFAAVCVLVYAFLPVLIFRRAVRMGAGIIPALVVTSLAYFILLSHALARPHIFTYVFFAILLDRLDDAQNGRRRMLSLWWLPLLAIVWCNIHPGFIVSVATTGLFAAVAAGRWLLFGILEERRRALAFGALLTAIVLATFANPYGSGLHAEIVHYLGMGSTRSFEEFGSPDFSPSKSPAFCFELLILLLLAATALNGRRLPWIEVALLIFFLQEGLQSVRHMNLFAIVAAPIVAREITVPLEKRFSAFHARWREIAAEQQALRAPLLYFPVLAALFGVLALARVLPFPTTLDDLQLTRGAADFIAKRPDRFARSFNTDDLGGSLIYRFWPDLHVFVDDRVSVYSDDFISKSYFEVFYGRRGWRDVLDRYNLGAAVVSVGAACTTLFRESPDWKLVYEDQKNAIFLRRTGP